MIKEIPIELPTVREGLRARFTGLLPEAASGSVEERERNFLSRSLAALALEKLGKCTPAEAAAALVDGGGDGGIDAIYYAQGVSTLWVVQSKFISDGDGEPDLSGVSKFKNGLEFLLKGNFTPFTSNDQWRRRIPEMERYLQNSATQVRAVIVYSGLRMMGEDRKRLLDEVARRFNAGDPDYFQHQSCNLTTIFDWLVGADEWKGVEVVKLVVENPGWIRTPYETIYGLVPLGVLAELYRRHPSALVAANLRSFKGQTEVNEQILQILREEPEHFFYLNNGLTAYCARLEVDKRDRDDTEMKRITAFRLSVVNGAQTLGAIESHCKALDGRCPPGYAFIRIISLERCADDQSFADRITRSTNFQNQVGLVDFASLEEVHERIALQLKPLGIVYHYREGVEAPDPDECTFLLKEAVTACACLAQQNDCDLVSRVLRHRQSLLSLDPDLPDAVESRHAKVFPAGRSARIVWRTVQAQRIILGVLRESARASQGIRKTFFEHSRWLIQNVLFLKLSPDRGEALALEDPLCQDLSRWSGETAELLWEICAQQGLAGGPTDERLPRGFKSVFGDPADCSRLRAALLQRMNQTR